MVVKIGVDPQGKAVFQRVDMPNVEGIIHGLNPFSQGIPNLSVVRANLKSMAVKATQPVFHGAKVGFSVKSSFISHRVHIHHFLLEEGVFGHEFDDLIHLVVEMIFFGAKPGVIEKKLFLSKARREDKVEVGVLLLEFGESFIESEGDVFGGELVKARYLILFFGRVPGKGKFQADKAHIVLPVESFGQMVGRFPVGPSVGEDQFGDEKDLEVFFKKFVVLESDEPVHVFDFTDGKGLRAVGFHDLGLIDIFLGALEKLFESGKDKVGGKGAREVNMILSVLEGEVAEKLSQGQGGGVFEQGGDIGLILLEIGQELAKVLNVSLEGGPVLGQEGVGGHFQGIGQGNAVGLTDDFGQKDVKVVNPFFSHCLFHLISPHEK